MIMKRLIGMTDFVLAETKLWSGNENESYEIAKSCLKYAQFLKQPLELWMFVPCDENGNIIEKQFYPASMSFSEGASEHFKNYQQAKERCLFESFDAKKITTTLSSYYLVNHKGQLLWLSWNTSKTIERLLEYNTEIELTPTAIKQLGL